MTAIRAGRLLVLMALVTLVASSRGHVRADDFTVAAGYFQAGQFRAAADAFDRLLANHPPDDRRAELEFLSGESLVQLDEYDRASIRFAEFLQRYPQHDLAARARFRIGECAYFQGQSASAALLLKRFSHLHSDHELNGYAFGYLANIALEDRNLEQAMKWYNRSLTHSTRGPAAALAHLGLVKVAYRQQRPAEMQRHLSVLRDEFDVLAQRPSEWHFWQGQAHLLQGETAEGIVELNRVIRINQNEALVRSSLLLAAQVEVAAEHYKEAARRLQDLMTRWPDSAAAERALLTLAQLEIDRGQFDAATTYLDQFRQDYPNSKRLRRVSRMVGIIHLRREQFGAAVIAFESLSHSSVDELRSDVERALIWYYLAQAYYGDGRVKQSLEVVNRVRLNRVSPQLAARVLYAKAALYHELGQIDEALETLERAESVSAGQSSSARVHWKRIQVLQSMGNYADAASELEAWEPEDTKVEWLYRQAALELAESAYESGHYQQSLIAYLALLAETHRDIDRADAEFGIAWCHLRLGDDVRAADRLSRFVAEHPQDSRVPNALMAIASIRERASEVAAAIKVYRQLIAMQSSYPEGWRAVLRLARLMRDQGRYDEAIDVLRSSESDAVDEAAQDRIRYERAWTLRDSGRRELANQQFEAIYQRGPVSRFWADATYRLALSDVEQNRVAEAQVRVDELLTQFDAEPDPSLRPYVLYLKARIAAQRKDWKGVILPLDEILGETSTSKLKPAALQLSAEAFFHLRDLPNAMHRLDAILSDDARQNDSRQAEAQLWMARVHFQQAAWQIALETAQPLVNSASTTLRARAQLLVGRCFGQLGETEQAIEALRRAAELARDVAATTEADAYRSLGDLYFEQRKYRSSLQSYLQVLAGESKPEHAVVTLQAGKCYERLGQPVEAVRLYRELVALGGQTPAYADALQRLRILQSENPLRPREPSPRQPVSSPAPNNASSH